MHDAVPPMGLLDKLRGKTKTDAGTVTDPVCHMQIKTGDAVGSSRHGAETYYFCSAGCKTKFDRDPHQYLGHHSH